MHDASVHSTHSPGNGLRIAYLPIDRLKPDPRNPRQHDRRQIKQIAKSIESFGFNVPILVDRDLHVIAGHGRLQACRDLGWIEVPTITLDHLSEAQARAFMIADNRLTEIAVWDDHLLAEQFRDLAALDLTFDLDATGFSTSEIDLRIEGLTEAQPDAADQLPSTLTGPAVSRPGDTWLLGDHRVFCGSALDAVSYAAMLGEEQAAMVFTDPPYNVPIDGHVGGAGAIHHREFAMAAGEMSPAEFTTFLTKVCRLLARHSRDGSLHYLCMDWRHMRELLDAGEAAYDRLINLCVWAKSQAGMGSFYRSQHELVFVFRYGRTAHRNNVELGRHGRHRSNLWNYPSIGGFGRSGEEGNLLSLHPTVKPVALVADAIMDCTARGDIVLDAFLGSGTTILAAERTGRRGFGIEIDPLYVDTAVRRWQMLTRHRAIHAQTGRAFDDLSEESRDGL